MMLLLLPQHYFHRLLSCCRRTDERTNSLAAAVVVAMMNVGGGGGNFDRFRRRRRSRCCGFAKSGGGVAPEAVIAAAAAAAAMSDTEDKKGRKFKLIFMTKYAAANCKVFQMAFAGRRRRDTSPLRACHISTLNGINRAIFRVACHIKACAAAAARELNSWKNFEFPLFSLFSAAASNYLKVLPFPATTATMSLITGKCGQTTDAASSAIILPPHVAVKMSPPPPPPPLVFISFHPGNGIGGKKNKIST